MTHTARISRQEAHPAKASLEEKNLQIDTVHNLVDMLGDAKELVPEMEAQ